MLDQPHHVDFENICRNQNNRWSFVGRLHLTVVTFQRRTMNGYQQTTRGSGTALSLFNYSWQKKGSTWKN